MLGVNEYEGFEGKTLEGIVVRLGSYTGKDYERLQWVNIM